MNDRMTFFLSFMRAIDCGCKNDAEKGKMYTAIMHYAFLAENTALPEHLSALFELIKPVIDSAKERKKKRTKSEQCSNNVQTMSVQNTEQCSEHCKNNVQTKFSYNENNVCTSSLYDIHIPISKENNNSLCQTFSYPDSVEAVLKEAERAGCVISEKEAERYFICRMSADWVDATGRKIAHNRIGYDLKRWVLNAEKNSKDGKKDGQREVKYVPKF